MIDRARAVTEERLKLVDESTAVITFVLAAGEAVTVGLALGALLGPFVIVQVGAALGILVGVLVGPTEGLAVQVAVGSAEGRTLGLALGFTV